MILTKALALLTILVVFWLGAAHAHTVKGTSPISNRFFARQLDCRDAGNDAVAKADKLCRQLRHRNADPRTFRKSGCWSFRERTITLTFQCE